jgi:superfamily I DNA/RNA helicase
VKAALIDEAQDLTALQWEVCQAAFSRCEKIMVGGDDYQAIFSHSGADPRVLIELAKRYPSVKLEKSYRLSREVYRLVKALTQMLREKVDKDFEPVKDMDGSVEDVYDRYTLMHKIAVELIRDGAKPGRWYFLFRNNRFIPDVTILLEQFVIPYHTAKGFVLEARNLRKIRRFYNYRKLGYGTTEAMEKFCAEYHIKDINDDFTKSAIVPKERRYVYAQYLAKYGLDALEEMAEAEPFILLSTIHRVKGGEADCVALFADCTRKVAMNEKINMDEEVRVLYVACTRTREELMLVRNNGNAFGLDAVLQQARELSA